MPARTVRDYENIIARLNALPVLIDQRSRCCASRSPRGLTQPQIVVDLASSRSWRRAACRAGDAAPGCVPTVPERDPGADQKRLLTAARPHTSSSSCRDGRARVVPARNVPAQRACAHRRPRSLPADAPLYDARSAFHTSTSMKPEEIHRLGLSEVARIEQEMAKVARADGFTGPVTAVRDAAREPARHAVFDAAGDARLCA